MHYGLAFVIFKPWIVLRPYVKTGVRMTKRALSPYERALAEVEGFSETAVAVLPETPPLEMLRYVAQLTGEDADKLAKLYAYFVSLGRLDGYAQEPDSGLSGFAED